MRSIAFCCLLFSANIIFSQQAAISGKVTESKTGESIVYAKVFLAESGNGTLTDETGRFEIKNIAPGEYHLVCEYVGYERFEEIVFMKTDERIEHNIQLKSLDNIWEPPQAPHDNLQNEVIIEGTRASAKTPMTYNEITSKDIEALNTGQDVPYLLRFTPSLVATSDAGNGVGYTGLWIRGSDPSRVNVTINGIPLNDPESQQVFWVNTPDLASSSNNIQIQRGIGTSANGGASFGGSIKIDTRDFSTKPYATIANSIGSFNTIKNNVSFGTGLLNNHFVIEGRLSRIGSDGYIDRAKSDLKSFYLEGNYIGKNTSIKVNAFGGREKTYQSWYGTPVSVLQGNRDSIQAYANRNYLTATQIENLLNSGRTYNFYDYANQVDHYGQDHYQAHLSQRINHFFRLNLSTHFTHGEGYFEEFKEDQSFSRYGLNDFYINADSSITSTDLIRRRWLKNDFIGMVGSFVYQIRNFESVIGGAFNEYKGKHYGELIWMQYANTASINEPYYSGQSVKHDGNAYWRNSYTYNNKLDVYADVQLRSVIYNTSGTDNDLRTYNVQDKLLFFNPKFGLKYRSSNLQSVYASIAKSGKEPNRNDYVDATDAKLVKPEEMVDLEAGYQFNNQTLLLSANIYYMNYKNQLVLTGELNDVGAPLRTNVDYSFRRGIELQAGYNLTEYFIFSANATFSQNKIKEFNEVLYDYTTDYDVLKLKHSNTDIAFSPAVTGASRLAYVMKNSKGQNPLHVEWLTKYVGKQYLDNSQNEQLTIAEYLVNDVRLSYDITSWKTMKVVASFMVNNVLNKEYASNGYTYSYIYGQRITEVFYYPQATRNYSFSLNLKF